MILFAQEPTENQFTLTFSWIMNQFTLTSSWLRNSVFLSQAAPIFLGNHREPIHPDILMDNEPIHPDFLMAEELY